MITTRPSVFAKGYGGTSLEQPYLAFFEKGWDAGERTHSPAGGVLVCDSANQREAPDFIRHEALLCNVKFLPAAKVKRSLLRVWM